MESFFRECYNAIASHINFETIKVILIGSPGFLNEEFLQYTLDRSIKEEETCPIFRNKSKFAKVHSSSGYKHAVDEILSSAESMEKLNFVKAIDEVRM